MQIELSMGKILFDMSFIPICDKPAILNKLEGLKLVLSSLCYILQDAGTFFTILYNFQPNYHRQPINTEYCTYQWQSAIITTAHS